MIEIIGGYAEAPDRCEYKLGYKGRMVVDLAICKNICMLKCSLFMRLKPLKRGQTAPPPTGSRPRIKK